MKLIEIVADYVEKNDYDGLYNPHKENGWDDEKNGQVRHLVKWECTRKIEMCSTMNRPRKECGCPDCGSSLTEYND